MRWASPANVRELRRALGEMTPDSRLVGGSTDLTIALGREGFAPDRMIHLGGVEEMRRISASEHVVEIGAARTMAELGEIGKEWPRLRAISDAASLVGSQQIRNLATLGGNVAGAMPAGDLLPVLWLLGAEAVVTGPEADRLLPMDRLVTGPARTALAYNEAIVSFRVPIPEEGAATAFVKTGHRRRVSVSRVSLAALLTVRGNRIERAELVAGAVAKTPLRVGPAEDALTGRELGDESAARRAAAALSGWVLEVNRRPNREYKSWAARGVLEDLLTSIRTRSEEGG